MTFNDCDLDICIVNIQYAFSKTFFFGQGHSPTVLLLVIQAPGQPSLPAAGAVYFTQKENTFKGSIKPSFFLGLTWCITWMELFQLGDGRIKQSKLICL